MKEITILSGKGGTGKTSIAAALASLQPGVVICDCDVDASDLHLVLHPSPLESHIFEGSWVPSIDPGLCTLCSICQEYCRFDAISTNSNVKLEIDRFRCEGCRLCERICPSGAITSHRSTNNSWQVSTTRFGQMVHARMAPGEENSGKLVTVVRRKARELAKAGKSGYILNDGPPGIGCPVIASLTGADAVLLVIEPTLSGLHDARRVVELAGNFKLQVFGLINKHDMNPEVCAQIRDFLNEKNIPLLGMIPYDEIFVDALVRSRTVIEQDPVSGVSDSIRSAWQEMKRMLQE
jgi:MinD superfamily P-loop ATPase